MAHGTPPCAIAPALARKFLILDDVYDFNDPAANKNRAKALKHQDRQKVNPRPMVKAKVTNTASATAMIHELRTIGAAGSDIGRAEAPTNHSGTLATIESPAS